MAVVTDLAWYASANSGLGGSISSAFHTTESTLTSAAVAGDMVLFDSALGGSDGDHDGKYIALLDGNSALYGARIKRYLATGGRMILEGAPLPSTAGIGDTYRLFPAAAFPTFLDADGQECADGQTVHCALYVRNNSVQTVDENAVWIKPINSGPVQKWELYVSDVGGDFGFIQTINRFTGPTQANLDNMDVDGGWSQPLSLSQGLEMQPRNTPPNLVTTGRRTMYFRRIIDPETPPGHSAVMLIFACEDPANTLLQVPVILAMDFDGFTPDITATFDRKARYTTGARLNVNVTVQETGSPAEDTDVGFSLQSPSPGSLELPTAGTVTDENGNTFASYLPSGDSGDEGDTVTVEVRI